LQERKIVFFVGGDDPQFDRSLPDEIAMNVADAVGDDVIIGDDMRAFANDEAAARNRDQLVWFGRLFGRLVVGLSRGLCGGRFRLGEIARGRDAASSYGFDAIFN